MNSHLLEAERLIQIEIDSLVSLKTSLGKSFIQLVDTIAALNGLLVLTGMGKSGLIARKIAATLSSTGTRAVYIHPGDALHGDMGILQKNDLLIALSNSGETREITALLPHIKRLGVKVVCFTTNKRSTLAKISDIAISYPIEAEGCPLELAPMASTTSMMALGDALSSCLMKKKNFSRENFGAYHPSGKLGIEVFAKVKDVMIKDKLSIVSESKSFKETISLMLSVNLGAVLVSKNGSLSGIITDGDLKRTLNNHFDKLSILKAKDIMTKNPVSVTSMQKLHDALAIMEKKVITVLPVVKQNIKSTKILGLIRMHDILSYKP